LFSHPSNTVLSAEGNTEKLSLLQAVEAQRVVRRRGSHICWTRLTDGWEVVSPTSRPPFTSGRFLVIISVRGWVDPRAIMWSEELGQLKSPMTLSRIEPATFGLQHSASTNYSTAYGEYRTHLKRGAGGTTSINEFTERKNSGFGRN
jgi:hypothetical protein